MNIETLVSDFKNLGQKCNDLIARDNKLFGVRIATLQKQRDNFLNYKASLNARYNYQCAMRNKLNLEPIKVEFSKSLAQLQNNVANISNNSHKAKNEISQIKSESIEILVSHKKALSSIVKILNTIKVSIKKEKKHFCLIDSKYNKLFMQEIIRIEQKQKWCKQTANDIAIIERVLRQKLLSSPTVKIQRSQSIPVLKKQIRKLRQKNNNYLQNY